MRYASLKPLGRLATRMAVIFAPPFKSTRSLAFFNKRGFFAPSVKIYHDALHIGSNVFVSDRVTIYKAKNGGPVYLEDSVSILNDCIIETGENGSVRFGRESYIHPRCHFNAYLSRIYIGPAVMVAADCAFYAHDHGMKPGATIRSQPLLTKGPIYVGADAWLGTKVTVLSGVRIGKGAVVGAGSVVTRDVPENAVAYGVPAKVIKMRYE